MGDDIKATLAILGVIYPPGPSGGRVPSQAAWTLSFTLKPWKRGDQIVEQALSVHKQVTETELDELMSQLEPYAVVQLRVRMVQDAPQSAELIEVLSAAGFDRELSPLADQLRQPVTRHDEEFGTLTFDRDVGWWQADVMWMGRRVRLYLASDDDAQLQAIRESAIQLWRDQKMWSDRISEFAVSELLELKNTTWLAQNEPEVTPEQFRVRMRLESITLYSDKEFEFMHDDGDLFWGHAIQICGDLNGGPTDADIPG